MLHYINDLVRVWAGEAINGISYQPDIEQKLIAQELAEIGLVKPAAAEPPPDGYQRVGDPVAQDVGGIIQYVYATEPIPPRVVSSAEVNAERDRRIAAGFVFNGKTFDYDEASRQRISGAGALAIAAIMNGAQPGDMLWHGGATAFGWIVKDNTFMELDAQGVVALGQAAAAWEYAHIAAARVLKDMTPIPLDFEDDIRWP